jgi:hypothetical protein
MTAPTQPTQELSDGQLSELLEDISRAQDAAIATYDDEAVRVAVAELIGLRTRLAHLESTQQPRPMVDAKAQRVLAEWFNPSGQSLGWDTTTWSGRSDMAQGHWDTEHGYDRPVGSAPRHWLPLPDQSGGGS